MLSRRIPNQHSRACSIAQSIFFNRLLAPRRRPSTKRRMKIFFSGKQQPGAVYGSGCASASASPLLLIGATRSMRSPEGARGAATNCSVMLWKTQRTRRAEKGGILSLPRQQTRAARAVGFLICGILYMLSLITGVSITRFYYVTSQPMVKAGLGESAKAGFLVGACAHEVRAPRPAKPKYL